ncbi:PREDICTED: uncharacterized protein LOC105560177, partial [Vollenhovia emeryi]|uniref:uncharacterized protein LOC105560177 n=1 Tax=Vollenhovia emeryi TaxID=411798 RepID=UPI0005F477EB
NLNYLRLYSRLKGSAPVRHRQTSNGSEQLTQYTHKPPLKQEVFNYIKPIYENLSNDELLERCLGGFTQNESFNSVVWTMAPEATSSGKTVLDMVADIAVCNFNDGLTSIMEIMQVLHMPIGTNCYNFCAQTDARRVMAAERSLTDAAKEARKALTSNRKEAEKTEVDVEGQLYDAGIAD